MKRSALLLKVIVGLFLIADFCFAQTSLSSAKPASPTAPGKKNMAVINLKSASGVNAGEADVISDRIRGELFNTGKVNVMERDQMQEILKEQGFQQSGACSNEACMVEMGQLLGVEQLVTGSLGKVGSIFLVNLRVIDVKTAKIIKVVSVDIKGDIEDVVGQLPSIAAQIVSANQSGTTTVSGNDNITAEEKKVEEEKVEEQKPEEKSNEAEPVRPEEKKDKNKNRGGIRVALNMYPANPEITQHYMKDSLGYHSESNDPRDESGYESVSHDPFINPALVFTIAAGPFITIDLGPSWTRGGATYKWQTYSSDYTYTYDKTMTDDYNIFTFGLGLNFVKRWYPFKLNLGLKCDFNYFNYSQSFKTEYLSYPLYDTSYMYHSFNVAFGGRAGAEILVNKRIGFNFDFIFLYSHYESFENEYEFEDPNYNTYTVTDSYTFTMPRIGFGAGFNFYF